MKNLENRIAANHAGNTNAKPVFVIRRSIFLIFVFFSSLIMLINLGILVLGLCLNKLLWIIAEGARPPTLLNIAIMAEVGSTISADALAQSHNDLVIAQSFIERIIHDRFVSDEAKLSELSEQSRLLAQDSFDLTQIETEVILSEDEQATQTQIEPLTSTESQEETQNQDTGTGSENTQDTAQETQNSLQENGQASETLVDQLPDETTEQEAPEEDGKSTQTASETTPEEGQQSTAAETEQEMSEQSGDQNGPTEDQDQDSESTTAFDSDSLEPSDITEAIDPATDEASTPIIQPQEEQQFPETEITDSTETEEATESTITQPATESVTEEPSESETDLSPFADPATNQVVDTVDDQQEDTQDEENSLSSDTEQELHRDEDLPIDLVEPIQDSEEETTDIQDDEQTNDNPVIPEESPTESSEQSTEDQSKPNEIINSENQESGLDTIQQSEESEPLLDEQDQESGTPLEYGSSEWCDRLFSETKVVPHFDIREDWCSLTQKVNLYYTPAGDSSRDMWSPEQETDFQLCSDVNFLVHDFLGYAYEDLPKIRGYLGFKSGGFCRSPAEYNSLFYSQREDFKCDLDNSGYYNPKCRPWYQKSLENPDGVILTDLYRDADQQALVSSICIGIQNTVDDSFYGALCQDINMIQSFIGKSYLDKNYVKGPKVFNEPTILQNNNELALNHLSENMLRAGVTKWELFDPYPAPIYGEIEISEGQFQISTKVNELDYDQLDLENTAQILHDVEDSEADMQKVFFILSQINLSQIGVDVVDSYQFFVFNKYEAIEKIDLMGDHLFLTVYGFWMPYLIVASGVYMLICGIIINYIATNMTKPFLELSHRIRLNVKNIQKRKKRRERDEKGGAIVKKSNYAELQVDLLKGYKQRNRDTDDLFFNFNSMAKIMFVGHASSQSDFSYQAFFNLHAAAELLQNQNNLRGAGACYMILGIKLAMQSEESYNRAKRYMTHSEQMQQRLIDQQQEACQHARGAIIDDDVKLKLMEDQYILAFRQYTRAIISYDFFVKMDEESRYKFQYHEDRRVDFMRHFDNIGLEALKYFDKCLESWPEPDIEHQKARQEVKNTNNFQCYDSQKDSSRGFVSPNANQPGTKLQKESPAPSSTATCKDSKMKGDIEMGVLINPAKVSMEMLKTPTEVLDHANFEEHCDDMLLSPGAAKRNRKKSCYQKNKFVQRIEATPRAESDAGKQYSRSSSSSSSSYQNESSASSSSENSSPQGPAISFSDEDSLISQENNNQAVQRKPPRRTFSGALRTKFDGQSHMVQDGFADYRIFIQLLIFELKVLLLPIYMHMTRNEHSESHIGAGGQSQNMSNSFQSDSQSFSRSFSLANFSARKLQKISPGSESEEEGDNPFAHRINQENTDKLILYNQIFLGKEMQTTETPDVIEEINLQIKYLSQKVEQYSSRRLSKIKRMGLPKIKKSQLKQNLYYLLGLHKFTTRKRGGDYNEVIQCFHKSLSCSRQQVNAISKKTLIKMYHILQLLFEKKWKTMLNLNYRIEQVNKSSSHELPRRLTKRIDRRISNQDRCPRLVKKKSIIDNRTKEVIFVKSPDNNVDDSMSVTSNRTYFENMNSKESIVKLKQRDEMNAGLESLKRNMQWVRLNLNHHVANQRSICFVLDNYFEHYKQHQLCKEMIMETFSELDNDDYFGLFMRQESHVPTEENLDILLEEKGSNVSIKYQILNKLLKQENVYPRRQGNSYMKGCLHQALTQSMSIPEKTIRCQELEFISPIKWVVAFMGNLKGLLNLVGLPNAESTNLLIVYVTDEQPDRDTINTLKQTIREVCAQGGLLVLRYRETFNYAGKSKQRDLIEKALQRIKSTIALYPSKHIPIIQEEFAL